MEAAPTISVVSLFLNADIVVKGVLILLLAASVWSWAVIIDKLWRLGAISRSCAGPPPPNNTSTAVVARGTAGALCAAGRGPAAATPAVVAYNKITVELGRFAGRMQGLIGRSGGLLARAAGV